MECCCCSLYLAAFFTGIAVLLMLSQKARYFVKFTVFVIGSLIWATLPIPLMLRRPRDYRNALIPAWGCRMLSNLIGITWELRGREHIVKNNGAVMLLNHQSSLDLIVLAYLWPVVGRCTVISKREIFFLWPFGLASYLWGTLFINRGDSKGAKASVNITAKAINEKHAKLCMFPEGTRHQGHDLLPFKKGAFHVAISCQCPIQPVVVSRYYWLDGKQFRFDSGHNIITILPAIETKGLTIDDMPKLMEETRNKMSEQFIKTTEESLIIRSKKALKVK